MTTRLVGVGLATVFFAVPSSVLTGAMGPYDEPKAWALAVVAGLTGLAWLAGRAFGAMPTPSPSPDGALLAVRWTLVAYAAWWGIATAFSIAPGQSLWGGFGRGFGLVVFLAPLILFAIVQREVCTLDRACHLIDLALIGSIPVVALALGQAVGWDPLPPGWDPATADLRVRSTFGQHIFLGSYLVALISLGVGRLITARQRRDRLQPVRAAVATLWALGIIGVLWLVHHGPLAWWLILAWSAVGAMAWSMVPASSRRGLLPAWQLGFLGALLTAQALALVLSTARGALIGLLTGLVAASAVVLVARRARRTIAILGSSVLILVLFVVVLNLGVSPLGELKGARVFARMGSIAELQAGSPGWVRLRLWEGILSGWARQFGGNEMLPGPQPTLRALIGYGPETQILILDRFLPTELRSMAATQGDWRAVYTFDRAHNDLLDHLVTTGVIGMVLGLGLVGTLVVTGIMRLRFVCGTAEAGVRLGCLATVLGQAAEGLVGIASPMPRTLFWVAAAILTLPSMLPTPGGPVESRIPTREAIARPGRVLPSLALLAGALGLILVIVGGTRSLLGSMAYAAGIRRGVAGDLPAARREFLRASHLAPWTPFPAEAAANVSLRMASAASDLARRASGLEEVEETLARARWYAPSHSNLWRLSAQVALAQISTGRPEQLSAALRDFSEASRLRPGDPNVLSPWALAAAQSGNLVEARRLAEEAIESDRTAWLAWAVLARIHRELGDSARAQRCAEEARRSVPASSRDLLERLLA